VSKTAAVRNLNDMLVNDGTNQPRYRLMDHSVRRGDVRCYFRGLQDAFIEEMHGADAVVGCVAWLTNEPILNAMQQLRCVSLIVQKEDFLRPDAIGKSNLRKLYAGLGCCLDRFAMPMPICDLSTAGSPEWQAVRCVGNVNRTQSPVHPRMHNKFAVFCRLVDSDDRDGLPAFEPFKVWTGSFNFTYVGGLSLENAVVLSDEKIVWPYFNEWGQISCLSEPLDWFRDWVEPEHRIGS
jgi:hypothetical protein